MMDWDFCYQNRRSDYYDIGYYTAPTPHRIIKKQFFAYPLDKQRKHIGHNEVCRFDFIIESLYIREFNDTVIDMIIFRWGAPMIASELEKETPRNEFKFEVHRELNFKVHDWFLKHPKLCSYRKKEDNKFICSINVEKTSANRYIKLLSCEACLVPDDFKKCKHLIPTTKTISSLDGKGILLSNVDCQLKTIKTIQECQGCKTKDPIFLTIDSFTTEDVVIDKVKNAIEKGLRKSIGDRKIEKEFEVRDIIDGLLTVAGYDFQKETPENKFSAKRFRPDLTSESLSTVIEVKLIKIKGDVSKSVEGLSADIEPYKSRFKNILFVVYDLGFVNDVDEYCKDFRKIDRVDILLVKR